MNAFLAVLEKYEIKKDTLRREQLSRLQANMGDLCNQSCSHCHIEASASGRKIMPKKVIDGMLNFLRKNNIRTLDITGGAPELNPDFEYLVRSARPLVEELIVRSNLTVLFENGKEGLPEFFRLNKVHLICSLPCYTRENVDRQRGAGVFEKSIKALKLLNEAGFAKRGGLQLDLVYNSQGACLPGPQGCLELDYKKALKDNYGIEFNRLLTITNVPVKKFKDYLDKENRYEKYSDLLKDNFNPATVKGLMCRTFLSVGFDGALYDCDFNLALGHTLKDSKGNKLTIDTLSVEDLEGKEIITGEHCLACTAGSGSSCQGALTEDKKQSVKEYYGKVLKNQKDLKTSACCSAGAFAEPMKSIIKNIEPEILDKFYGCGSPLPPLLEGCRVLDLGSGTGRDVYIASSLVGQQGFVTGVDMTDEQLHVAEKHKDAQMKRFGFKRCNVDFKKGYIEDLKEAGIQDNSQDLVISNCVINLSPDKKKVFSEIFRVLKQGGELYFADVFVDRRLPESIKNDSLLYGECLGGALYIEDFRRILAELGCPDYRVISKRRIHIDDPKLAAKAGDSGFYSMTIRAFKLEDLEDRCEDFGQAAYYLGSIPYHPDQFQLDNHHLFVTDKPMPICGNTALMLSNTRFTKHFKLTGDRRNHFGLFSCLPDRQACTPASKVGGYKGNQGSGGCC